MYVCVRVCVFGISTILPPQRRGRISPLGLLSRLLSFPFCCCSFVCVPRYAFFFLSLRSAKGKHPLFRRSIYVLRRKQMTGRIKTMAKSRQFSSLKLIYVIIIFNNAKKGYETYHYRVEKLFLLVADELSLSLSLCFCFFHIPGLTRVDRPETKDHYISALYYNASTIYYSAQFQ